MSPTPLTKPSADVLETTRAPILATHSCARALTNSPRNLTDDQLRAIAQNNGAVMVNFYSAFIDERYLQQWVALKPERDLAHLELAAEYATRAEPIPFSASNTIDRAFAARIPRPPLRSLIDHIDHISPHRRHRPRRHRNRLRRHLPPPQGIDSPPPTSPKSQQPSTPAATPPKTSTTTRRQPAPRLQRSTSRRRSQSLKDSAGYFSARISILLNLQLSLK